MKWQLKQASEGSGAKLTESYPAAEPFFQPAALTALFRVAQEAITMIFNRGSVKTAGINLQIEDGGITMRFTDDGVPNMVGGLEVGAANAMTSMKHRIRALGGTVELLRTGAAGTILEAYMPLPKGPEIWLRSDDIQRAESSHHCRLGSFFRPFWASKMPVSMVDGY